MAALHAYRGFLVAGAEQRRIATEAVAGTLTTITCTSRLLKRRFARRADSDSLHLLDPFGLGAGKISGRTAHPSTCSLSSALLLIIRCRPIRKLIDAALKDLSRDFGRL